VSVQSELEQFMASYLAPDRGAFSSGANQYEAMESLAQEVRGLASISGRPHIRVKGSVGQGNWAAVPWLALMDRRITTSTTHGVYAVFLFRSDMSGVYLTLNQGVTEFRSGSQGSRRSLMVDAARRYASMLECAEPGGFRTGVRPELKSPTPLGTDYEYASIAQKWYPAGAVPEDSVLNADLECLLRDYDVIAASAEAPQEPQVESRLPEPADVDPWDEFCYWAGMEIARPDFDAEERTYKLEIAERLDEARGRLLASDAEWLPVLKKAFGPPNNLTSWQVHAGFLDWCQANRASAERALRAIWVADASDEVRVGTFVELIPDEIKSARRIMILAFLLMALGPESHPPYRTGPFEVAYRLTQYPLPASGLDRSGEYAHVMRFLDMIIAECAKRGVELRDRLDAQSVLWAIVRNDPFEQWDGETKTRFLAYRGEVIPEDHMIDAQTIYDELCSPKMPIRFPEWIVSDYLLALGAKPFVLLSGISGTGKTQIAQVVAKILASDEEVLEAAPVVRDDSGAVYHRVGRSTLTYGLVIPSDKEALFMALEPGPSTPVTVDTGLAHLDAFLGRVAFTGGRQPVLRLMWRKPTLEWIRQAAQLGDVIKITPNSNDETRLCVEVIKPTRIVKKSDARRVAFVPVRADWTDNRDLLGFYNVLTEQYEATDLLRVLLRAADAPDKLHFVILDEMNLAKVEYYFADFLSVMETADHGQGIPLHDHEDEVVIELDGSERRVPNRLPVPANVLFTGTVNVDETTHMFSRKVLDRANVIEFHEVDVRRHLGLPAVSVSSPKFRLRADADVAQLLARQRDRTRERSILAGDLGRRLAAVHDILRAYNLHFGYRVVDECARFLLLAKEYAGDVALDEALDLQVLQKVLPKLAGNRSELQLPLERLLGYFVTGVDGGLDLGSLEAVRELDISTAQMPLSAAKVKRMLERLMAVGFTSFVE
jgi:5-methylcytosine-specific restriction enzyme B